MGMILNVAVIIKTCLIIVIIEACFSYEVELRKVRPRNFARSAPTLDECGALENRLNKIGITQREALDFVVELVENETAAHFEDGVVVRVADWLTHRQDLIEGTFEQVYLYYIEDTCNKLQSIEHEQQSYIDELSPLDHNKLKLKLVACETLLESKAQAKVKALVTRCKSKNNFWELSSSVVTSVICCCFAACCLCANMDDVVDT